MIPHKCLTDSNGDQKLKNDMTWNNTLVQYNKVTKLAKKTFNHGQNLEGIQNSRKELKTINSNVFYSIICHIVIIL